MKIPLEQISNFIKTIYKPSELYIEKVDNENGRPEHIIHILLDDIDDSYLTNPNSNNIIKNKESNLEYEIRRYIKNFFGVETSGLDISTVFPSAPYKRRGLGIDVIMKRN